MPGETRVEKFHVISEYDSSIRFQTFSLNCNGAAGNMIYITDLEVHHVGHGISELAILEAIDRGDESKKNISKMNCNCIFE